MQVQNVLRGTQQAESHTQDLGTEGPEGAASHVTLMDCAPGRCTAVPLMRKGL